MATQLAETTLTYQQRLEHLRKTKRVHTRTKQQIIGAMDYDDWAVIPPPEEMRDVATLIGPSGEPITDPRNQAVHLLLRLEMIEAKLRIPVRLAGREEVHHVAPRQGSVGIDVHRMELQ